MSFFKDIVGNNASEDAQDLEGLSEASDIDESIEESGEVKEIEEGAESEGVDKELLGMMMENNDKEAATKPVQEKSKSIMTEEDKSALTVITKGTTINGSIVSDCSLDIMGTINGDIECLGKLSVSGSVIGNLMASEIYVSTDRLEGNLTSEGSVKIGLGTVVIGNINGSSAVVAGAVKGEIDVNGPVVIDSTAIIKGNVKAKSVQMNNGAVLEGFCSLTYASVDIDNVFD